jgi:hypothetical protein
MAYTNQHDNEISENFLYNFSQFKAGYHAGVQCRLLQIFQTLAINPLHNRPPKCGIVELGRRRRFR